MSNNINKIKFRGKRVDNGEWVYGYLLKGVRTYIVTKEQMSYAVVSTDYHASLGFTEINPETLGMFIGIKDRNDVEVYAGDKIEAVSIIGVVEYDNAVASFIVKWEDNQITRFQRVFDFNDINIVGNIYAK